MIISSLAWIAAILLPLGYWKQVWHIHQHKEVRDLNLSSYIFFAIAYLFLGIEAYAIDSVLFLTKNIMVIIPTGVIIYQVIIHRNDEWVECPYERMAERSTCPKHKILNQRINAKSKAL